MDRKENAYLAVKDIVVEYTSGGETIYAVNGVSFELERGKTLGLVGETGAGKTTIAKTILRILPDPPAKLRRGEIYLDGESILDLPEREMLKIRGNKIAMIFQDPMTSLNPVMSVGEQIVEVLRLHDKKLSQHEAEKKAGEMLELVGIPRIRFGEYPFQFSGGMKQRVVIAMALACNPSLLLADEPTTALDVTIQAQILDLINELKEKYHTAMIMITHDLGVVAQTCDHVAVVYAGQIVEYGDRKAIFVHPTHPYTQGLFGSLPNMSQRVARLAPIKGLPPNPAELPEGCAFAPRCPHATDQCRQAEIPLVEIAPGHLCRCCRKVKEDEAWQNP